MSSQCRSINKNSNKYTHYHFVTPPSIHRSCPVIYLLASLAKNIQAPLISSGSATLPFIISPFQLSNRCGKGAVISVRTYPGDILLTRIPFSAPCRQYPNLQKKKEKRGKPTYSTNSAAIGGTIALTAPFVPQYALEFWDLIAI